MTSSYRTHHLHNGYQHSQQTCSPQELHTAAQHALTSLDRHTYSLAQLASHSCSANGEHTITAIPTYGADNGYLQAPQIDAGHYAGWSHAPASHGLPGHAMVPMNPAQQMGHLADPFGDPLNSLNNTLSADIMAQQVASSMQHLSSPYHLAQNVRANMGAQRQPINAYPACDRNPSNSSLPEPPTVKPSTQMLQMLQFPRPEPAPRGLNDGDDHVVRLTLTVCSGSGSVAPGLSIEDCGRCIFCLDKPKNGGPGTKRQKCTLKRMPMDGPTHVWTSLRVVSARYLKQLEDYAAQKPPPELLDAAQEAPLKLVWGFRRARRARPLPPAYVLMYHCERHVTLDRSYLAISLEQRRLGNRTVARSMLQFSGRLKDQLTHGGHSVDWSSDGTELQEDDDESSVLPLSIPDGYVAAHHLQQHHLQPVMHHQMQHVQPGAQQIVQQVALGYDDPSSTYMNDSEDDGDPNRHHLLAAGWDGRGQVHPQLAQDPSWQELNRMLGLTTHDSDPGGFSSHGYLFVQGLVSTGIVNELNTAADRRGSRARRNSKTISGSALQMDTDLFTPTEQRHVQRLVNGLLSSHIVQAAASVMWGEGCQQVPLRLVSCSILEGGTQQMPHADALYASALVCLVSLRNGQAPTLVHRDRHTTRTAFSCVQAPHCGASEDAVQRQMSSALDAIDVVSQPDELCMVPAVDCMLESGDVLIITSTLVHAGPGGFAEDGKPRRVAFVTFEPQHTQSSEGYDPSLQYNAALYWFRRCHGNQDYFFEQLHKTRERWLELGHDPTTFLTDEGAERYRDWEMEMREREMQERLEMREHEMRQFELNNAHRLGAQMARRMPGYRQQQKRGRD